MSNICELKPFSSQVTPQDPPSSHSIELLKQELEQYLRLLREAICADMTSIEERLDALEQRVTDCCGSV